MNEPNTTESDEKSIDDELRLSSGSSSDSSYASESSSCSNSNQQGKKRKRKSYKLMEEYDNPCSIKIHTYFVIQKKLLIRLC